MDIFKAHKERQGDEFTIQENNGVWNLFIFNMKSRMPWINHSFCICRGDFSNM